MGYVFYSGSPELFERHQQTLGIPVGTTYVGENPGFAALHDVALLSAMYGMFAGAAHAFALIRKEDIDPAALAPLLADWLVAMAPSVHQTADQLRSGDYTKGVVSNLAMQVAGDTDLPGHRRTAGSQPGTAQSLLRADAPPPGQGRRRGGPDGRDRPAGALTRHVPPHKRRPRAALPPADAVDPERAASVPVGSGWLEGRSPGEAAAADPPGPSGRCAARPVRRSPGGSRSPTSGSLPVAPEGGPWYPCGLRGSTTAATSPPHHPAPAPPRQPAPPNLPRPPTASAPRHSRTNAPTSSPTATAMLDLVEDMVEPSGGPAVTGAGAPHLNAVRSRSDVISPRAGRRRGGRRRTTLAPVTKE